MSRERRGATHMTYVITQPCIGVKDGSCVDVCPVDCIHPAEGESDYDDFPQLYINPDECIDCGACGPPARSPPSSRRARCPRIGRSTPRLTPTTSSRLFSPRDVSGHRSRDAFCVWPCRTRFA